MGRRRTAQARFYLVEGKWNIQGREYQWQPMTVGSDGRLGFGTDSMGYGLFSERTAAKRAIARAKQERGDVVYHIVPVVLSLDAMKSAVARIEQRILNGGRKR